MGYIVTEKELYEIPVPEQTETYIPVPNEILIKLVKEEAKIYNLTIREEIYKITKDGQVMTGVICFNGFDGEIGMSLGLRNSYDKSKTVAIGVGGHVFVCTNGMFSADLIEMRKHTGNVIEDLQQIIRSQFYIMNESYEDLVNFKNEIKEKYTTRLSVAHMLGELFYEEDILNVTQLSKVKKEMDKGTFRIIGESISLWQVYNWITEALKSEHPADYLDTHVRFHKYFKQKLDELTC